jgi:HD-GYP domain-containing protein (c-di-GMP phosphodiesterase class II)
MGEAMGLSDLALDRLERGAWLHDIGKLFIPSFVAHKQNGLNPDEYRIMQRHAGLGARLLKSCAETAELAMVARCHHERWDGRGYPDHLQGNEIPLLARITSVADVYDAMTSNRPGGNHSHEEAAEEILHCRETQFCPEVVDAFIQVEAHGWEGLAS